MRWLALISGAVAGLAVLRWLVLRALPWDPEWMNDPDDNAPFEADPYLLDLLAGLGR